MTSRSAPIHVEPGYLLYERDGRVMAQRFDSGRLALVGDAVAVADAPERSDLDAEPVASASRNGRLAVLRSSPPDTRLELIDRSAATLARYDLPPGPWAVRGATRDGRRAAVLNGRDIWIVDLERSVPMRFASTTASAPSVVWAPAGDRLAFVTGESGREEIHLAGLDGKAERVPTTEHAFKVVLDWSPDGRYIVYIGLDPATGWDLWLLPLEGEREAVPYLLGPAYEGDARVSPDGRWLAYTSTETGKPEIYVQSFPGPGHKVRVSLDGGDFPAWANGGRELLYSRGQTRMSVPVVAGEEFRPGAPRPVFTLPSGVTGGAVLADGERFLLSRATETRPRDIEIVLDWEALLRR